MANKEDKKAWLAKMAEFFKKLRAAYDLSSIYEFAKLPEPTQQQMRDILAARSDDGVLFDNLRSLITSGTFPRLPQPTQALALKRIKGYGGDHGKIESLQKLIVGTFMFEDLTKPTQNGMMNIVERNSGDGALVEQLSKVALLNEFRNMDQPTQDIVLERVQVYPREDVHAENLVKLLTTAGFDKLDPDVRDQLVRDLPYPFGSVPLTTAMISNLMTLVTTPDFENVAAHPRSLMLELLSARPKDSNLAKAFQELVERRALHDPRTAGKLVFDADSGVTSYP